MQSDELHLLRSEDLLSLARNPAAKARHDAVRILVERGSPHAGHVDIIQEATDLVLNEPMILKKYDPSASAVTHKLPGLIDVINHEIKKTKALQARSTQLGQETRFLELALTMKASDLRNDIHLVNEATKEELLELIELAEARIEATEIRLVLLERSLWRKFVDWFKRLT